MTLKETTRISFTIWILLANSKPKTYETGSRNTDRLTMFTKKRYKLKRSMYVKSLTASVV
jgi:hypothetical protein